ncbi:hypothetical protein IQ276_037170 [Desmonostoc muscorum LEGE 12446]|uniref:Uncharacterized protein n=1 Tax=Desmonostoc muscorum LEGE 12446 TaxID=1828758 RepID=A0A8J7DG24_DESMC|nr:hypothetical protein [Desmonostoc muscorum]MCF2151943.1 hypothetical protein [Desmonostoc muscorum LEGE 12446]
MPYTKEALQNMYSLSPEDVLATLIACGLADDAPFYSDADIETRFDVVRQLFKDGEASDYQQATTLFQQKLEDNSLAQIKNEGRKPRKKAVKPLDITELINLAREIGFKLTLTKALQVLASCGLKEKEEYTPSESERFLGALTKVSQQAPDVLIDMEDITTASEKALASFVDGVTDRLVEKIPLGLVKQVYTQKAIARLAQQPEESDDFFIELEEGIMRQLEGKPAMESPLIQLMEKHRINLLPPTSIKSMQLPSESESDTTIS